MIKTPGVTRKRALNMFESGDREHFEFDGNQQRLKYFRNE